LVSSHSPPLITFSGTSKTSRQSGPLVQLFFLLCCCCFLASYPVSLINYGSCHKNATVLYRSFESYHIYIKRENALLELEIEQYTNRCNMLINQVQPTMQGGFLNNLSLIQEHIMCKPTTLCMEYLDLFIK
jgi:hypothetical protein